MTTHDWELLRQKVCRRLMEELLALGLRAAEEGFGHIVVSNAQTYTLISIDLQLDFLQHRVARVGILYPIWRNGATRNKLLSSCTGRFNYRKIAREVRETLKAQAKFLGEAK